MQEVISTNKLAAFRANLASTSLAFPDDKVSAAFEFLNETDFPTTRHENWKYTRLARIANLRFDQTDESKIDTSLRICAESLQFVFHNGNLIQQPEILPNGLTVKSIQDCSAEELANVSTELNTFEALNLAYASNGLFIQVADKTNLEQAIEIIHYTTGNEFVALRNVIQTGALSKSEIILNYLSLEESNSLVNVVTDVEVGAGTHLTLHKIQTEAGTNFHVSKENVKQDKDSNFTLHTTTLNGNFVRNDVNVAVNGQNCETNLYGAYILNGTQHVDNHTVIDHKVAHCLSNELYKGVIDDKATAVFNGKVFVRKDAQKINAFQSNANVLMSDDASVNSKPELEIYADDVKCSHGSTTGQLDEEAVFYLRARGISEKSARNLVVSAFVNDALEKTENEEILAYIYMLVKERFGWEF
jgi:Fe-S cluster assembly protein SufD